MCHKGVLELDRGDPLPPALYEVFAAVGDLDEPETVYGDDVPGLEPSIIRELVVPLGRLVIRAGDPRATDFEFAHRLPVPRNKTLVAAGAYLHERYGIALLGLVLEPLLLGELLHLGGQVGHGPDGAHLRHAPGVDDLDSMLLLVVFYERLGRRRPPDDHRPQPRQVVLLRLRVERLQHSEEDRRYPSGQGHAFLLQVLEEARRVQVRAWHHQLGPDEDGGVGQAPCVDVEHRDDGQYAVGLGERERVAHRRHHGVEYRRAVRVESPLRASRRPRGVAHRGSLLLVEVRVLEVGLVGAPDQVLVGDHTVGHVPTLRHDYGVLYVRTPPELLEDGHEGLVDEHDLIIGVACDVGEVVLVQPWVQGVQHKAR